MQPIQMAQRPLIAQQAFHYAPTVALQLLARLVELGLRGLTAIEPPLRIKPRQRSNNQMHLPGSLQRLTEEHRCLMPGAPAHTRDAARLTPLLLPPCHLPLGLSLFFV